MRQIIIIHGGTTYPSHNVYYEALQNLSINLEKTRSKKDWKSELENNLGEDFVVYNPQFPNKQNAQYKEWKILFEKIMDQVNDNVILVGHSMGGIFLAKYLSENKISKLIKKTFLISAPFDEVGMEHDPLCSFVRVGNLKDLERQIGELFLYHSRDDKVVPFEHFERYVKELPHAKVRVFDDRGHFKQESIAELIEDIKIIS